MWCIKFVRLLECPFRVSVNQRDYCNILFFFYFSNPRNAKKYVNPDKEQVFTASCLSNCGGGLKFRWLLYTCSNETSECESVPSDQLTPMLKGPIENTLFYHTRSSVYKANQWYMVMFRAYRTNDTYGEVSFRFYVNLSPHSGKYKTCYW